MIIQNVRVSTHWEYSSTLAQEDEEEAYVSKRQEYIVTLEIPIPGGIAKYSLPSTKEINDSIDKASELMGKKR